MPTPPSSSAARVDAASHGAELPTSYQPAAHEDAARARWSAAGAFCADPSAASSAGSYSVVIPPPNVTARLHLGHALNNTIQDTLVRWARMRGLASCWLPGADHAGIATQTVVEKRLIHSGKGSRADYAARGEPGRDAFLSEVHAWSKQHEVEIRDQLIQMGASCDFDRWRFTMDAPCQRAVREAFFRLFQDGLIYRGKRLVNWDPVTETALADDEVESRAIEGFFYYMRYPVVDGSGQATGDTVTVATTRPETYMGDTAVAVNPSDAVNACHIGKRVRLPFVNRLIPIIGDDYVVVADPSSSDKKAQYASGFLKVTPAHDPNDWEIGQRHNLEALNVLSSDGVVSAKHGWHDFDAADATARSFVGLAYSKAEPRNAARDAVLAAFAQAGFLDERFGTGGKKPYTHDVGHSYRSGAVIEPYLSDQWYVKVSDDRLCGAAQRGLSPEQRTTGTFPAQARVPGDGRLRFYPARYAKTYESWHDNLRDWCISRQLWWGHRIPVWSFDAAGLTESIVAAKLNDAESFSVFVDPHACRGYICTRNEAADARLQSEFTTDLPGLTRDPDVLDTWFSSALWPMSTLGWPDNTPELRAFNPTSVLSTARDIITLWVSRMVMFNRYFLGGQLPFTDVYVHAMIQDGQGRKMSKSLGNGVDPVDIIKSRGADAMRFTLCKMTTQTQDVRLPVERDAKTGHNTSPKFDEGQKFANKLWNASRFTLLMLSESTTADAPIAAGIEDLPLIDRWMLSRIGAASVAIDTALHGYQFSAYATALYDLVWRDFCDWYLEAIKPSVRASADQQAVLRLTLEAVLRFLHPVMPFVTETIYQALPKPQAVAGIELPMPKDGLLCSAPWPGTLGRLYAADIEANFARARDLVEAIRNVRAAHKVHPRTTMTLHATGAQLQSLRDGTSAVQTLANVACSAAAAPDGATVFQHANSSWALAGAAQAPAADPAAELERLSTEKSSLTKQIRTLTGRLSNPGYTEKAPPHLVEQSRAQLADLKARLARADAALEQLG